MNIVEQIGTIKKDLNDLIEKFQNEIDVQQEIAQKFSETLKDFDDNWKGRWASKSYNYYKDFIDGTDSTLVFDEDSIAKYLEDIVGLKISTLKERVLVISKAHREFQNKLLTEFSIIKGIGSFQSEIELLEKIERQKWGIPPWDYIKSKRPQSIMTDDPERILNKGLDTPPHLTIGGELISLFSTLTAAEDFEKNAKRVIRQLELKTNVGDPHEIKEDFILKIINSFHRVTRQLQNRHNNRSTITISDEYDVQDLLHGLLKIQFEDIRPEEYTPSYAGSATRMDFLLKNEKTVIEVKKTREGLRDKDIGDQLILDVNHYKAHPHCKRLICFIYDPESRIINPRGLETDLNQLSNDDLIVEVFIRP